MLECNEKNITDLDKKRNLTLRSRVDLINEKAKELPHIPYLTLNDTTVEIPMLYVFDCHPDVCMPHGGTPELVHTVLDLEHKEEEDGAVTFYLSGLETCIQLSNK